LQFGYVPTQFSRAIAGAACADGSVEEAFMSQGSVVAAPSRPADLLKSLYRQQLATRQDDAYLTAHAQDRVADTQTAVFDFYARYLPAQGNVLDWGCRHAPDACLMYSTFGGGLRVDGCDFVDPGTYSVFHGYANLRYLLLDNTVLLPYADSS